VKSAEQLPAILFTGLSFNAKIWSSPLSSGTLKRQMRPGHGTTAEKPTLKFTSADGLTRYVHRRSLISRGPHRRRSGGLLAGAAVRVVSSIAPCREDRIGRTWGADFRLKARSRASLPSRWRGFMNSGLVLLLACGIGVVAGRSMTAPAVVAWAAHLGWINLSGSALAFMGSAWAVGIFTLGALVEFIADQLPTTPARTTASR
jgi:hypothetical protein